MNSSGGGFIFKSRKKKVQKGTLRSTLAKRTDQIELLDGWSCRYCARIRPGCHGFNPLHQPPAPQGGASRFPFKFQHLSI